jgi:hypothetical protein
MITAKDCQNPFDITFFNLLNTAFPCKVNEAVELLQQPKLIKNRDPVTNAKRFLALGNAFGTHKIDHYS